MFDKKMADFVRFPCAPPLPDRSALGQQVQVAGRRNRPNPARSRHVADRDFRYVTGAEQLDIADVGDRKCCPDSLCTKQARPSESTVMVRS